MNKFLLISCGLILLSLFYNKYASVYVNVALQQTYFIFNTQVVTNESVTSYPNLLYGTELEAVMKSRPTNGPQVLSVRKKN